MLRSPGAGALAALQSVHITLREQEEQQQQRDAQITQAMQLAVHCELLGVMIGSVCRLLGLGPSILLDGQLFCVFAHRQHE